MPFKIFKKVIDEYSSAGGKRILLTPLIGDVFLDRGIFQKIKYAKNKGMYIRFYTNGILLGYNDYYKKIIDSGIDDFSISVGDVSTKIDSEIYGITESLSAKRWDGLYKLLDYAREAGKINNVHVMFRSSRSPYEVVSDSKFKKLQSYLRRDDRDIQFLLGYDNWGGAITEKDLKGVMKFRRPINSDVYPCMNLFKSIIVMANGSVRLCSCRLKGTAFDELVIGDISKDSLLDLLNNGKAVSLRENFVCQKPEVCKDCILYEPYF